MSEELIQAATEYLMAGLTVIALSGKAPNTKFHQRGLHDAISGTIETEEDVLLLMRVFGDVSTTGIGLPIPEHMVVVDIDGEDGAQQWRDLVGDDELTPDTGAAKTGRGLHLWFATPRAGQGTRKLGPKLDLKGVGGYVAAPPSLHPDGHRYEWLDPLVAYGRVNATWLPDPIEKLLATWDAIATENTVERSEWMLYELSLQDGAWRLRRTPTSPPLDGLVRTVENAEEGNRNNMLAWATLTARDEGATLEDVMRELGDAGTKAGLTAQEVRTTIRAAYRRGRRQ